MQAEEDFLFQNLSYDEDFKCFFNGDFQCNNQQLQNLLDEHNLSENGINQFLNLDENTDTKSKSSENQDESPNLSTEKTKSQKYKKHSNHRSDQKNTSQVQENITSLDKKKLISKNYRQRKKQYLFNLQKQNELLKKRNIELEKKLKDLESQICTLKFSSEQNQTLGFQAQYEAEMTNFKQMLINGASPTQLQSLGVSIKNKYGIAGTDRIRLLNYYMSEYMHNTLADVQKYLMTSAINKTGIFGQKKSNFDLKMEKLLDLNLEKTEKINHLFPIFSQKNFHKYVAYGKQLYRNYIGLLEQSINIQNSMCNWFCKIVDHKRFIAFLFWFIENKHTNDVRNIRENWLRIFTGESEKI